MHVLSAQLTALHHTQATAGSGPEYIPRIHMLDSTCKLTCSLTNKCRGVEARPASCFSSIQFRADKLSSCLHTPSSLVFIAHTNEFLYIKIKQDNYKNHTTQSHVFLLWFCLLVLIRFYAYKTSSITSHARTVLSISFYDNLRCVCQ